MNNLYLLDRVFRIIFSLVLLYLSGAGLNFYTFFAITLLGTASLGYCPIYKIFGVNLSLEDKNKFLTQLPKYNPEPVFIFSDKGTLIFQNNAAKKILPELKFFKELSSKNPKTIIQYKEKTSTRYKYKDKTYLIESIGIPKEEYIVAYGFNITEILKGKEILKQQIKTDWLTNLGNRVKLLEDIEKIEKDELSLLVFDVIKFSQINGFFGHKKGDEFLKQFALEIKSFAQSLKFTANAYRLRGNTFAILIHFENLQSKELIKNINKALFELFKNIKIEVNNIQTNVEIRVGIASKCTKKDKKFLCSSLLNNAETALSEAKKESLEFKDFKDMKDISERYKNNINWANKLRDIFDHKCDAKLKAYFQPIYNIQNRKIEKFEALVRIEDGNKVISPFMFLDVAKQINFLTKITKEVTTQALDKFKDQNFEFSLNLTSQDLKDDKHLNYLCKTIEKNGFKTSSIVLEILEDEDMYEFIDTIANLKTKGFKLAIDDFGTGYSNFQKLQQLNVDYIKIDGSLVKNVVNNPKDLTIIKSICNYAEAIGVKTIAEFVADESIYELIKTSGVDYVQGYYIGEPNPTLNVSFQNK